MMFSHAEQKKNPKSYVIMDGLRGSQGLIQVSVGR